ncbi:MAG: type II toxin-antitoxin system HicB family antitoxin [Limisphaerales bacterium]
MRTREREYEIVIEKEEDRTAGYLVYCPALPGCFSNGGTPAEAKRNMREAMELYIETLVDHGEPVPPPRKRVRIEHLKLAVPA